MKELSAIIEARSRLDASDAVLATIVNTSGSSYRRAGAHMLILSSGETFGSVSGGCLEQDVIAHAAKVRATGESILLTYDTTAEEDVLFGVGLGCKGVIEIWLEPMKSAESMLEFCEELFKSGESGICSITFRGPKAGERSISRDTSQVSRSVTKEDDAGSLTFYELIQPPVRLFIFGAGYDAVPLTRMAKQLGYEVAVVDRRPAYATHDRFPDADKVHVKDAGDIPDMAINIRTAVVIMSHHYISDRDYLKTVLPLPLTYVGLMGPRRRADKMLQELSDDGMVIDESMLERLHNPIGLNIGAEGPDEIALSILAEIQAVLANRDGGLLRNHQGPIHPRMAVH